MKTIQKTLLTFLLIIVSFGCGSAPGPSVEFEGTITYLLTATSKNPEKFSTGMLQQKFGDTAVFYYKNGIYKMQFTGNELEYVFYDGNSFMEYTKTLGNDSLMAGDCSLNNVEFSYITHIENDTVILGKTCNKLVLYNANNKRIFYYTPDIYIDPVYFKNYELENLNQFYTKAKSQALLTIYEGINYDITYQAIKIQNVSINDSIIKIPNSPLRSKF